MDRELYYIPEEEKDGVIRSQMNRQKYGTIQLILSFICTFLFVCTDVEHYELPWWIVFVGLFFLVNGVRMLRDFDLINRKYNLYF